jgi:hypothetical protein
MSLNKSRLDISNLLSTKKKLAFVRDRNKKARSHAQRGKKERERSPPMPKASAG